MMCAIFITFQGNCKEALTFYQTCFGGLLQFDTIIMELPECTVQPVVVGSLVADRIVIHGSDLVHNEGRRIGNYLAVFMQFQTSHDRNLLMKKLEPDQSSYPLRAVDNQRLVEVTDAFDVRWVLGV